MSAERLARPKFAMLTNFDDKYDVGYLCAAVNAVYCRLWGHEFLPCVLDQESMKCICEGRHFAWAKIALLRWFFGPSDCPIATRAAFERWLPESRRAALMADVDFLVWVDGDAMVLDHSIELCRFVEEDFASKSLVASEDMAWCDWINTGVLFVRTKCLWVASLWSDTWVGAERRFHQAPFWDQSGFCQALLRRGEIFPDVLGARATGLQPAALPWFSWMGGRSRKQTQHMGIVDVASLQFANPLHAQFVLHLCGYSEKYALCHSILQQGWLRGLPQGALAGAAEWLAPAIARAGRVEAWREALLALERAKVALEGACGGWGGMPAAFGRSAAGFEAARCEAAKLQDAQLADPVVFERCAVPAAWSLSRLRYTLGECMLSVQDCSPLGADDVRRNTGAPWASTRATLWQICDYVRGLPPPCHPVLGCLDPLRRWRVAEWRPWQGDDASHHYPLDELVTAFAPLWRLGGQALDRCEEVNASLATRAVVHIEPPGVFSGLHRPCTMQEPPASLIIWQLEGVVEYVLCPPDLKKAQSGSPDSAPFFDASHFSMIPWAFTADGGSAPLRLFRAVLGAGDALIIPEGWWVSSLSARASLSVWRHFVTSKGTAQFLLHMGRIVEGIEASLREPTHCAEDRLNGRGSKNWSKTVVRAAIGTEALPSPPFQAVVRIELLTPSGPGLLAYQRRQTLPPRSFVVPGPGPRPFRHFDEVVLSMLVGELCRVAVRGDEQFGGSQQAMVLMVELLSAAPQLKHRAAPCYGPLMGGWTWFGDVKNWLGAPAGHEPEDKVGAAQLEAERRQRRRSEAAATARCRGVCSQPPFAAISAARRAVGWPRARRHRLGRAPAS